MPPWREQEITTPLLTVTYVAAPDDPRQNEVFEFFVDGQRRTFGRDRSCDIVIWSAMNTQKLTRVAGEIWRSEGELWLRNLSTSHELFVTEPGQPAEEPLRRRPDRHARGYACSIPAPVATVTAPDGCRLDVHQLHQPSPAVLQPVDEDPTVSVVPDVPPQFRRLAAALCEPLLSGSVLPAAYREVMARIGQPSLKIVRNDVAHLCSVYTKADPRLARRVNERRNANAHQARRLTGLTLPDYYEVALLLVRYQRITRDDVHLLALSEGG